MALSRALANLQQTTDTRLDRLDKFYLLLRRFVGASFRLLAREQWDLDAIKAYNEVLTGEGGPLK